MAVPPASFSRLRTQGLAGYNLAWSPFYPDKLAVAGSANVSVPIARVISGSVKVLDMSFRAYSVWSGGEWAAEHCWAGTISRDEPSWNESGQVVSRFGYLHL